MAVIKIRLTFLIDININLNIHTEFIIMPNKKYKIKDTLIGVI